MTSDRSFFTELDMNNKGFIYLADGSKIHAEGYGHGTLVCTDDEGHNLTIPVKDVLYVPNLEGGLLSVKRLTARGLTVKFQGDKCFIQNGKQTIASAKLNDHLYHLNTVKQQVRLCTHKHNDCIHIWHRRLGHRHPESIQELQKRNLTKDLTVSPCSVTVKCECCIKSKATRATLPKASQNRASRPLDLVHSDVCGPLNPPTSGGNRYIVTFIDDYSRYTVTYLMQHKSEVFEKLQDYITKASNKFQRKPLVLRTDNGGEFTGHKIQEYLKMNGIEHQKTVPYTPEQNGVAERKNRTLTEMIRCMLTDSGLPQKYWGEAAMTATYLQNRLFSRTVEKTPYEMWHNVKPCVNHLKVFGCKAFIYIPEEKRTKLQNRAFEGVFVGYSDNVKGYRILNPKTDKITISNSVTFLEDARDDVMTTESVKAEEKIDTDHPIDASTEETVEVSANYNNTEQQLPAGSDTGLRRSTRENKGKAPVRLSYKASTATVSEPATWEEISQLPEGEASKWMKAAEEEIRSMNDTKTWTLTELPPGRKAIGCKWTFKLKYNADGSIERYKARLVAKGYSQKYGEDYDMTFAPVVKHATIRTLLAVAAKKKMKVRHFDVKTAFLHGELAEEMYMEQPPGFKDEQKPDLVCKLHKSIYGLKQAARAWNIKINEVLTHQDFERSKADPCLYTKKLANRWIYMLIYVDDILICFEQEGDKEEILKNLNGHFETKDLGDINNYLGIQIEREEDGSFLLNQRHKIQDIIQTCGMEDAKPVKSPMETNYLKEMNSQDNLLPTNTQYRQTIGKLLYLTTATRPDIAASVGILCRKVSNPSQMDWNAVKRIIRYLKGTLCYKLKLPASDECTLTGFVDADWAGDTNDRKSTSGYLFLLSGGVISWTSRKQLSVTLSSTEAEYVAAAQASQEVIWLRQLLADLGQPQSGPTQVYEDNQGCIALAQMERVNSRTKHIDVKFHFLRDLQEQGLLELLYCPTEDMTADILTKPLTAERHSRLTKKMQLTD